MSHGDAVVAAIIDCPYLSTDEKVELLQARAEFEAAMRKLYEALAAIATAEA